MNDDTPEPLFAYPPIGPQFTFKEVAETLTDTGVPWPTAQARVRAYVKDRLVHVREKGKNTRPNLFEFSELGVALILSALQDAGVQDKHVLAVASTAAYSWHAAANERDAKFAKVGPSGEKLMPRHPVDAAINGTGARDEFWIFALDIYRDSQSGERLVSADLRQFGQTAVADKLMPPSALPVATVQIPLLDMFQPVIRRLIKSKRH